MVVRQKPLSLREVARRSRDGGSSRKERVQMSLPYQGKLIPRAKELRKDATKQENHLWYDFLRGYPMRFQRQKTIDGFIADFYCHVARLVVEVDGSQHYDEQGLAYDKERSAIFAEYGVKVIRCNSETDGKCQAYACHKSG